MAKNKVHHKKPSMRVSIAVLAGLAPGVSNAVTTAKNVSIQEAGRGLIYDYTGYNTHDGTWSMAGFRRGAVPLLAGMAAHFVAQKTGINRQIARVIPFVSI